MGMPPSHTSSDVIAAWHFEAALHPTVCCCYCCCCAGVALQQVPAAVLQHIAEGLANVQDSSPVLPPEWEARMRELLSDTATQAAINSVSVQLAECTAQLHSGVVSIVDGSGASIAAAAERQVNGTGDEEVRDQLGSDTAGVRYIGIAVVEEGQVQQQLQELWVQLQGQRQQQQQQDQDQELQPQHSVQETGQLAELQLAEPQAKRQRQGPDPLKVSSWAGWAGCGQSGAPC